MYVDDLIVTRVQAEDIDHFKREMAACFKMSDLNMLFYYLGIEVRQGKEHISLGQRAYAEKLLERGGMVDCKSCATPIEEWLKISKHSTAVKVDVTRYRSIINRLRYLTHTRSDIAFVAGYVSRFMEDPREDHWMVVKSLLRYVKGSLDQAIIFCKRGGKGGLRLMVLSEAPSKTEEGELELTVFSDADMAGDIDGRWSTSGVLIFLGAAPIAWQSLKQKIMVLLTCEAEYVTAAMTTCQAIWLRRLLGELTGKEAHPRALMVDNQPAITLTKNPVLHDRSTRIGIKFHFLQDCIDGG